MHPVSVVVIVMILMLFILSVVLLMTVSTSYRKQKKLATVGDTHRSALVRDVLQEFTAAYNTFGQETNTPAIITSVIHEDMSFSCSVSASSTTPCPCSSPWACWVRSWA